MLIDIYSAFKESQETPGWSGPDKCIDVGIDRSGHVYRHVGGAVQTGIQTCGWTGPDRCTDMGMDRSGHLYRHVNRLVWPCVYT